MACAGIGMLTYFEHAGHQGINMWPKIYGVAKVFTIKHTELRITWVYCVMFSWAPPPPQQKKVKIK
jgi:hypothetical protein